MVGMARSTFPLRLSDPVLRAAVREVAEHERVSQNEYIEQAIRNDLLCRGVLRAQQLEATAARLASISEQAYAAVLERSLVSFATGEALPDPVQMRALHEGGTRGTGPLDRSGSSILDAVAAFRPAD